MMARMPIAIIMLAENALYDLMSWLSPAYPVGAFAHSSGIEWAVGAGWIACRKDLEDWLTAVLECGGGWNDAVLVTAAHRAATASNRAALALVAELAAAAHPSQERRTESLAQGAAFRRVATATMPQDTIKLFDTIEEAETPYSVVVAVIAATCGIGLATTLTGYLHACVANLISAGQRLVPLGQTEAQAAMVTLKPVVLGVVERSVALPDGDPFRFLGSATLVADAASMWHETQYTRLFRT